MATSTNLASGQTLSATSIGRPYRLTIAAKVRRTDDCCALLTRRDIISSLLGQRPDTPG